MLEQQPYNSADNGAPPASVNDQHLACVLLLDTSSSMRNRNSIDKLNRAIGMFKQQCMADDALCRGLDIAMISFNSEVSVVQEFTPVTQMEVPYFDAVGQTAMGGALSVAMDLLENRKAQYKEIGIPYHRPWIFMITDGGPNDDWGPVFQKAKEMQQMKKLEIWAVGVPGYDRGILTSLTHRVIELDDNVNLAGLFEWLSNSLSKRSSSNPGDRVQYNELPEGSRVIPSSWGD